MEVQVRQVEGVTFSVKARTQTIICDQPPENGGTDAGMTPPELFVGSVGACAAYYAVEYLRTRRLASAGVAVSVAAEKLKGPARLGNFRIRVDSPVGLTVEQKEGLMRSVEHCLIKNTLLNPPEIKVELNVGSEAEKLAGASL